MMPFSSPATGSPAPAAALQRSAPAGPHDSRRGVRAASERTSCSGGRDDRVSPALRPTDVEGRQASRPPTMPRSRAAGPPSPSASSKNKRGERPGDRRQHGPRRDSSAPRPSPKDGAGPQASRPPTSPRSRVAGPPSPSASSNCTRGERQGDHWHNGPRRDSSTPRPTPKDGVGPHVSRPPRTPPMSRAAGGPLPSASTPTGDQRMGARDDTRRAPAPTPRPPVRPTHTLGGAAIRLRQPHDECPPSSAPTRRSGAAAQRPQVCDPGGTTPPSLLPSAGARPDADWPRRTNNLVPTPQECPARRGHTSTTDRVGGDDTTVATRSGDGGENFGGGASSPWPPPPTPAGRTRQRTKRATRAGLRTTACEELVRLERLEQAALAEEMPPLHPLLQTKLEELEELHPLLQTAPLECPARQGRAVATPTRGPSVSTTTTGTQTGTAVVSSFATQTETAVVVSSATQTKTAVVSSFATQTENTVVVSSATQTTEKRIEGARFNFYTVVLKIQSLFRGAYVRAGCHLRSRAATKVKRWFLRQRVLRSLRRRQAATAIQRWLLRQRTLRRLHHRLRTLRRRYHDEARGLLTSAFPPPPPPLSTSRDGAVVTAAPGPTYRDVVIGVTDDPGPPSTPPPVRPRRRRNRRRRRRRRDSPSRQTPGDTRRGPPSPPPGTDPGGEGSTKRVTFGPTTTRRFPAEESWGTQKRELYESHPFRDRGLWHQPSRRHRNGRRKCAGHRKSEYGGVGLMEPVVPC